MPIEGALTSPPPGPCPSWIQNTAIGGTVVALPLARLADRQPSKLCVCHLPWFTHFLPFFR